MPALPTRHGLALILSGPSGAGKSSVTKELLAGDPELRFSVSCTTRAPRQGEVDGRDYYFLSEEEFAARVAAGAFLEHAKVHRNHYGTLRSEVMDHLRAGRDVLLDIDVQGAALVRQRTAAEPEWQRCLRSVFMGPPSLAELERRLRGRGTDAEDVIQGRLAVARAELAQWREYDYLVVNETLADTVAAVRAILAAERRCVARLPLAAPWGE